MPTDPEWPHSLHQLNNCPPLNGVEGAPIGLWVAGDHHSTVVWDDLASVEAIHGHGGATRIAWVD